MKTLMLALLLALGTTIAQPRAAWEPLERLKTRSFYAHTSTPMRATLSGDETRFFSSDGDNLVIVWNAQTGAAITGWSAPERLQALAASTGGTVLIGIGQRGKIHVWGSAGQIIGAWGTAGEVKRFVLSPDGRWLFYDIEGQDTTFLCQTVGGTCVQTIQTLPASSIGSATFSPDSQTLYLARSNGLSALRVSDAKSLWQIEVPFLDASDESARSTSPAMVLSPNGARLLAASNRGLEIVSARSGSVERTHPSGQTERVLRWSADGTQFATAEPNAVIKIWDAKTFEPVVVVDGQDVLSFGSAQTLTTIWDNSLIRWNATNGTERDALEVRSFPFEVRPMRYGKLFTVAMNDAYQLELIDGATLKTKTFKGDFAPRDLQVSPDGSRVALTDGRGLHLYSASLETEIARFKDVFAGSQQLAWSPDGARLAAGDEIVDATTGTRLQSFEGYPIEQALQPKRKLIDSGPGLRGMARSVAWSPDGQTVAIGYEARAVGIWDTRDARVLRRLIGHTTWVLAVAWRPDGRQLASADGAGNLRFWNPDRSALGTTRNASRGFVRALAYSPDGRTLASTSSEGDITLWDTGTLEPVKRLKGHTAASTALAWSADGKQLVSGSSNRSLRVWDVRSGATLQAIPDLEGAVLSVAVPKDGERLLALIRGSFARAWGHRDGSKSFEGAR